MQWQAIAVAVPGYRDKVCEDSAQAHPESDLIVVADGLGSTGRGAEASALVTRLVMSTLRTGVKAQESPTNLGATLRHAFNEATSSDRALATTCLYFYVTDEVACLGRVGDGLAVIALTAGEYLTRTGGKGAFANETESLPSGTLDTELWPVSDIDAVMLATDGVADDLKPEAPASLLAGFTELLRAKGPAATKEVLLQWLSNWRTPNSNDDRSVALLVRMPGETS